MERIDYALPTSKDSQEIPTSYIYLVLLHAYFIRRELAPIHPPPLESKLNCVTLIIWFIIYALNVRSN